MSDETQAEGLPEISQVIQELRGLSSEDRETLNEALRLAWSVRTDYRGIRNVIAVVGNVLGVPQEVAFSFLAALEPDSRQGKELDSLVDDEISDYISRLRALHSRRMHELIKAAGQGEKDWTTISLSGVHMPRLGHYRIAVQLVTNDGSITDYTMNADSIVRLARSLLRDLCEFPSEYLDIIEEEDLDGVSGALTNLRKHWDELTNQG